MHDDSTIDATPLDHGAASLPPLAPAVARGRRWPIALVGSAMVVAAIVAPLAWVLSTTVPEADHAEVTASLAEAEATIDRTAAALDRTEASLADTQGQRDGTMTELATERAVSADLDARLETLTDAKTAADAELASARAEVESLTEERATARARLEPAFLAARAFGFWAVTWSPEEAQALVTQGLDTASPDAILVSLGQDEPFLDWVQLRSAWIQLENAMYAIDDAELSQHYEDYLDAAVGSPEEMITLNEMTFRLTELIVGPMMEEAARCVPPAAEATPLRSTTRDC